MLVMRASFLHCENPLASWSGVVGENRPLLVQGVMGEEPWPASNFLV